MVKNIRVTLRKRTPYATKSKVIRVVKTPGHRLVAQYVAKRAGGHKCGDCGGKIHGIAPRRPIEYSRLSRRDRTVTRAYGGSRCAKCTKDRIIRAFLIQEKNVSKKADRIKKASALAKKAAAKKAAAKKATAAKAKKAAAKKAAEPTKVAEQLKKGSKAAKKGNAVKHAV